MKNKHLVCTSKNNAPRSEYQTCFDQDMGEILHDHGQTDLLAEIELIRYLNLVTLKRMNTEGKKLSYRDHLATLRVVTLAAGEIAHLASTQNKVFSPLVKLEDKYKQEIENTYKRLVDISKMVMGRKKVEAIQEEANFQIFRDASGKKEV
jgi:hypothetical protein